MMAITKNYSSGNYQGVGDKYTPNQYEELGNAIGKIAEQVLRGVSAEDKLSVFDKKPVDNGDTIEQAVVKLVEGKDYDRTGTHTLDRDTTEKLAVSYFKNWTPATYKTTIDKSEIRKILETGKGVEEVADKLVGTLSESEKYDKYSMLKDLLAWGKTSADGGTGDVFIKLGDVGVKDGATDYKGILKLLKNTVKGMQYVSTKYNKAGIKQRSFADDIVIIAPYQLITNTDVDDLAGVFNLDKAEVRGRIIEIDVDDTKGSASNPNYNFVYILDKWSVLSYTRLYEMDNQKNAEGRFWNYYLQTDRLYALSKLFNGAYFKYLVG